MGTLYNCLQEVRLEKYYPAFRANGITRWESLANMTMPEFFAMGISGAEDTRRLVDLVNIIKSVHRNQSSSTNTIPRKRQPASPTQGSGRNMGGATGSSGFSTSLSNKKVPRRRSYSPMQEALGGSNNNQASGLRLEPTRDVSVRERGPNFCAASYVEMLELMSDSGSQSDGGDQHSGSTDGDFVLPVNQAAVQSPALSNKVSKKMAPVEKVKLQTNPKGYNYGVPSYRDTAKPKVRTTSRAKDDKIRVCVRKRPLSRRESRASDADIVEAGNTATVIVREPKVAVDLTAYTMKHEFVFDEVFNEDCSNEDVYIRAARPLIGTAFQRCNATFFAYGQTGAGKTHTMIGGNGVPGLYQLAAQDIFNIINSGQHGTDLHVWVSFFEIYCGQLFDLLNKRNRLIAREDGSQRVCIAGLTETEVPDVDSLIKVLQFGNSVRSRGTSGINPDSSRSHAVLQLEIRNADDAKLGKISFIDLAGSERASDMGDPDKQTRMEGAEINQSLLALKECIRSIDQESRHTPFRQSKLTHILKDAFVGNSRTCMIANVSPAQSACEHTLNTLRYADRVKELRRDSGPAGAGASFGQAMNLLMNIPITAPSVFHPSRMLSTSTPLKPKSARDHSQTSSHTADITFNPSETPIRGHIVNSKPATKVPMRSRPERSMSNKQSWRPQTSWQSEVAASQGFYPAHPEASPSESDQTDTDSNNVTHPTETRSAPSQPNIPVIRSTDTEFDFPTSDFNNVDEQFFNDLNKANNSKEDKDQDDKDHDAAASASGPRSEVLSSRKTAVSLATPSSINNLPYRTSSISVTSSPHGDRQPKVSQSLSSKKFQHMADNPLSAYSPVIKGDGRSRLSPKISKTGPENVPESDKVQHSVVASLRDSFDDELLFIDPEHLETAESERGSSSPELDLSGMRMNRNLSNVIPAVQTAVSSDLTSFAQRSTLGKNTSKAAANLSEVHPLGQYPNNAKGMPKGAGMELARTGERQVPSPQAAAIKDWVSRAGDKEYMVARVDTKYTGPQAERVDSASSAAENIPHSPQERYLSKTGTHNASRSGMTDMCIHSMCMKDDTSQESSSESLLATRDKNLPFDTRSGQHERSSSLPTLGSTVGTKQVPGVEGGEKVVALISPFTAVRTAATSVLVTEKLISGAVFSPIHPQPICTTSTTSAVSDFQISSQIIHPTPVAGIHSNPCSSTNPSQSAINLSERHQARMALVSYHEDQLATITSLCKQEMKLLLSAKKTVPRSFDDYMNRLSGILAQKMSAIQLLQDQIKGYRTRFHAHPLPLSAAASAASVSDSDSGSLAHS